MTAPMATQPAYRAHWDRGDGYDARDPNAPFVPSCAGCDALIFDGVCADCTVTLTEEAAQFTRAVPHPVHGFAIVDRAA